jgi:hypothetical protein
MDVPEEMVVVDLDVGHSNSTSECLCALQICISFDLEDIQKKDIFSI